MAQKNYKNRSLALPMIFVGIACFALGGLSGFLLSDYYITHNAKMDEGKQDSIPVDFSSKGMQVRMLSSVTNEDGSITKTIGYTVLPADATNKDISVKLQYADGTSCADLAAAVVDQEAKTVAITIKAAFSKEIHVVLQSVSKSSVQTTIYLNYEKKLLALDRSIDGTEIHVGKWNDESNAISGFEMNHFIAPEYSVFTYDKEYSFVISDIEIPEGEFSQELSSYTESDPDLALNMSHLIQDKIIGKGSISAEEIWGLSDAQDWHYLLSNFTEEEQTIPYYHTTFTATYASVSQPETKVVYSGLDLYLSLAGDYIPFVTEVEEIQAENPVLIY